MKGRKHETKSFNGDIFEGEMKQSLCLKPAHSNYLLFHLYLKSDFRAVLGIKWVVFKVVGNFKLGRKRYLYLW